MSNPRTWNRTDRFIDAKGAHEARIVSWADGWVTIHYRRIGAKREQASMLHERYWLSPRCGWRKA